MQKILLPLLLLIIGIFLSNIIAFAEGGGKRTPANYGINRRVNSNIGEGLIGVSGNFTFDLETPITTIEDPFFNASPKNPLSGNLYRATPTYYLGSYGPGEVDAGLQYYSDIVRYPEGRTLHLGWGAFIRHRDSATGIDYFITPKTYIISEEQEWWEGFRDNSSSSYNLSYQINSNGHVEVSVSGDVLDFTFPWTKTDYNSIPSPTHNQFFPSASDSDKVYSSLNNVGVKRVIGMTQGNVATYELDGSVLVGTYSKGKVLKSSHGWIDWESAHVNDTPTGYDVGENERDARWNNQETLHSQLILTFPNIESYKYDNPQGTFTIGAEQTRNIARTNDWPTKFLTQNKKSRYVNETIKISLRSATRMVGAASHPHEGH